MVLLTGHVILWAKLRKPRFAGGREFGTALEIENENDSWFLGLLLLMGSSKPPATTLSVNWSWERSG